MEYFNGEKITLRALEIKDLDLLYAWENNPAVWTVSNTITPYSRHILQKYIEGAAADIYSSKQLRMVIEKTATNQAIGFIDLFAFDPYNSKVGIGILIAENQERDKGFATQALELMVQYVEKHLGLNQVYCNVTTDNGQSIRLFENAGFIKSGIKKEWIRVEDNWLDEIIFQRIFKK
jgi:diamine N-acetyltransferase